MGPMPIFWLPKGMIVTIKLRYYSSFKVQQDQPVIEFYGDRYQIPLLEYQKLVPIAITGSNGTDVNAEFTVSENMDVWRLRIQTPFGPNLQTLTIKRKDKSADQVFELYSMGSSWAQAISPMLRLKEGDKFILKITTKRPEETLPEIVRNRAVFLEIGTAL
jgi:hypothetical protein